MAFFSLFLQADGSGGGGSGGRKNRRGLTTMSLNESRGSAGGGDRGITGGVSTYVYGIFWFGKAELLQEGIFFPHPFICQRRFSDEKVEN